MEAPEQKTCEHLAALLATLPDDADMRRIAGLLNQKVREDLRQQAPPWAETAGAWAEVAWLSNGLMESVASRLSVARRLLNVLGRRYGCGDL